MARIMIVMQEPKLDDSKFLTAARNSHVKDSTSVNLTDFSSRRTQHDAKAGIFGNFLLKKKKISFLKTTASINDLLLGCFG